VGGRPELLKRIQGPEHDRLAADIRPSFERRGGPDKLVVSRYAPNRPSRSDARRRIQKRWASRPRKTAMEMLLLKGEGGLVSFNMAESDIELNHAAAVHHDLHRRRSRAVSVRASRTRRGNGALCTQDSRVM